jgi:hypothetical protein
VVKTKLRNCKISSTRPMNFPTARGREVAGRQQGLREVGLLGNVVGADPRDGHAEDTGRFIADHAGQRQRPLGLSNGPCGPVTPTRRAWICTADLLFDLTGQFK